MSIDPHGRFGPLGKYGAYGRIGSAINLIFSIVLVIVGTTMIVTQGFAGGAPGWFALLWCAAGVFVVWRSALVFRSVRRREREKAESEHRDGDLPSSLE